MSQLNDSPSAIASSMKWLKRVLQGKQRAAAPTREMRVPATTAPVLQRTIHPSISDRGKARFFHGRTEQRHEFAKMLAGAGQDPEAGTTFLVQGAPGAGKTALLHQMALDAGAEWTVVHIRPQTLESTAAMAQALGKAYIASRQEAIRANAQIATMDLAKILAGTQTVTGVLQEGVGPREKILLVLDEAQHLAEPSSPEAAISIRDTLNDITNGGTERHVALLLGGLGHTESALSERGLSRLRNKCCFTIGRFEHDATAAKIIRDWLTAGGCDPIHIKTWTDIIAPAADNWPQHIIAGVAATLDHFHEKGDIPAPEAVQSVLWAMAEAKAVFYFARIHGLDTEDVAILGMAIGSCGPEALYDTRELLKILSVDERDERERDVLQKMQNKGVLSPRVIKQPDGAPSRRTLAFCVPIPSMERHLIMEALNYASRKPQAGQRLWHKIEDVVKERGGVSAERMRAQLQPLFDNATDAVTPPSTEHVSRGLRKSNDPLGR